MILRPAWAGAAALLLLAQPAFAGPCAGEIHDVQIALNAKLDAAAARGRPARQTTFAQLHRQPTPSSIANAEAQAGDIPEKDVTQLRQFLDLARNADAGGDMKTCRQALADARRLLGP